MAMFPTACPKNRFTRLKYTCWAIGSPKDAGSPVSMLLSVAIPNSCESEPHPGNGRPWAIGNIGAVWGRNAPRLPSQEGVANGAGPLPDFATNFLPSADKAGRTPCQPNLSPPRSVCYGPPRLAIGRPRGHAAQYRLNASCGFGAASRSSIPGMGTSIKMASRGRRSREPQALIPLPTSRRDPKRSICGLPESGSPHWLLSFRNFSPLHAPSRPRKEPRQTVNPTQEHPGSPEKRARPRRERGPGSIALAGRPSPRKTIAASLFTLRMSVR